MSDLMERMRSFELDHEPHGWPAVQMRDISAMCGRLEQAEARVAEYDSLVDEMDKATRLTYLSGPVVVGQFKRLRQQADEAERAGGGDAKA